MRFMMLMIPLGYETAPPDVQLDPERVKAMSAAYETWAKTLGRRLPGVKGKNTED